MISWRRNDGLTLVELMVSITIGSLIMLAASTVLLLGFRINHQTTKSVTQQHTARTVITLLENMATEGSFNKVERDSDGSWKVGVEAEDTMGFSQVLLSYSSTNQTIYTGEYDTPILENVIASYVMWENKVLTISLEDDEQTYTSSVYCRTTSMSGGANFNSGDYSFTSSEGSGVFFEVLLEEKIQNFLEALISQVGMRGGIINHGEGPCTDLQNHICKDYNFFSEWYIGGYSDSAAAKGWGADTAWCGCFISWGLSQKGIGLAAPDGAAKWFANVDSFMSYFTDQSEDKGCWKKAGSTPSAGDLIFFNMISDDKTNPSHMGAVLKVENGIVYTIEGNSADMVAVREYSINDARIIGYGDPWAAQTGTNN